MAISGSSSRRYAFGGGCSLGIGTYAFLLGGGATNGFFMKVLEAGPPGLKGAIGGAAGLLNAAMRSRNAFELGLLDTTGGGALAAGALGSG